jgi:ATP-dependent protease ClpP protease subunit
VRLSLLALLLVSCVHPRVAFRGDVAEPQDPVELAPTVDSPAPTADVYADAIAVEIGDIDRGSLAYPALVLKVAAATGRDVVMVIDSPGGSVYAGFDFVDSMRAAQAKGVTITCLIPRGGMAASMAAYVLESCDRRYMHRQSMILFHSVSVSNPPGGTVDDVERFAREIRDVNTRLAIHIVGRLEVPMSYYLERTRGDWWVGYEEALEIGAVDGVFVSEP